MNIPRTKDSPPAFEGQPMRHLQLLPGPAPAATAPIRFRVLDFLRDLAAKPDDGPRCAWCGGRLPDPSACSLCGWRLQQAAVPVPVATSYVWPWRHFLALPDDC